MGMRRAECFQFGKVLLFVVWSGKYWNEKKLPCALLCYYSVLHEGMSVVPVSEDFSERW